MNSQDSYEAELAATGSVSHAEHARDITEKAIRKGHGTGYKLCKLPDDADEQLRKAYKMGKLVFARSCLTNSKHVAYSKYWTWLAFGTAYGFSNIAKLEGKARSNYDRAARQLKMKYPEKADMAVEYGDNLRNSRNKKNAVEIVPGHPEATS
jgi:hypothetical protein